MPPARPVLSTCVRCLCALGWILFAAETGLAMGDEWDVRAEVQHTSGRYSGSILRDRVTTDGLLLAADYLDDMGFTLGVSRTRVDYKSGFAPLDQDELFVSVRKYLTPDQVDGRFTLRLDGHAIDNDDPTGNSDGGRILSPQIAYQSRDRSLYLDLGYTGSEYRGDLSLQQWTPSVGTSMNQGRDWVRMRGYLIRSSNSLRTQGKQETEALELTYTHFFEPGAAHTLDSMHLGVLLGERVYAVDPDLGAAYNLADTQTGSVTLGLGWDISEAWGLSLVGGVETYTNGDVGDDYENRFLHIRVSMKR